MIDGRVIAAGTSAAPGTRVTSEAEEACVSRALERLTLRLAHQPVPGSAARQRAKLLRGKRRACPSGREHARASRRERGLGCSHPCLWIQGGCGRRTGRDAVVVHGGLEVPRQHRGVEFLALQPGMLGELSELLGQ